MIETINLLDKLSPSPPTGVFYCILVKGERGIGHWALGIGHWAL